MTNTATPNPFLSDGSDTNSVRRCSGGVCGLQIFNQQTDGQPGRPARCSMSRKQPVTYTMQTYSFFA